MENPTLFEAVKNELGKTTQLFDYIEFDAKNSRVSIKVKIGATLSSVEFYITEELYFIRFANQVGYNFIEQQNIQASDIVGDVLDIFNAIEKEQLHLVESGFLKMRASKIQGLDEKRFVRHTKLIDPIVLRWGKALSDRMIALPR